MTSSSTFAALLALALASTVTASWSPVPADYWTGDSTAERNIRREQTEGWAPSAQFDCAKHMVVPEGVTSIYGGAFSTRSGYFSCASYIESVTIPNSVTSIGPGAFSGCFKLKTIVFPNSLKSIGAFAFTGIPLTSIVIPDSVTSVGEQAFFYHDATSIVIGKSLTSIGKYAFYSGRASVSSVYVPNCMVAVNSPRPELPRFAPTVVVNTPTAEQCTRIAEDKCFVHDAKDASEVGPNMRDNIDVFGRDWVKYWSADGSYGASPPA